jgi:hypothetical protein
MQKRHSPFSGFACFGVPRILFLVVTFFTFFSCKTLSPANGGGKFVSAPSPETLLPQWVPLAALPLDGVNGGLAYCAGKLSVPRLEFYALRVDLSEPALKVFVAAGAVGSTDGVFLSTTISSFVRDNKLLAGINALPFDPVSGKENEPRINVGIVIADGVTLSPPHPHFDALVFYADGGAAIIAQPTIQSAENIVNAVGGFYRVLENGEPVPRVLNLKDRHPRSAAGISPDGKYLYLLVIDGRRLGSIGGTEKETALLLRSLGAAEGINFDGGGSSALVLRYPGGTANGGTVRAVNTPIHGGIPGRERAVAGCLGIR